MGAILLAFGVGLPVVARSVPGDDGFRAGEAYPVTPEVFVTPATGWIRHAARSELGVTLVMVDGPAELTVDAVQGVVDDLESELSQVRSAYAPDYTLAESRPVGTPTGLTGAMFTGSSSTARLQAYALSGGGRLITVVATWPDTQDRATEVQQIVDTLEVR